MAFHTPFEDIVTLTKRNNRYYGPTESKKIKGQLSEISTDMVTIYNEISSINDSVEALASGFLYPTTTASGYLTATNINSLYDLKRLAYKYEDMLEKQIYIEAYQTEVLE